ncbi:MAG TPA: hypothetical protein PKM34_04240 [Bacteroidales bacterium]|nr:hypothetical protein [Bacteroidales bacterium]
MSPLQNAGLYQIVNNKGKLKKSVYHNTLESLNLIKKTIGEMLEDYRREFAKDHEAIPFVVKDMGEFEIHLQFAGDVLIFNMHTNVFEFSRYHDVMSTSYIREDKARSYCGIINIYNFLADSFKYDRANDIGYLIGRIFINKDKSYFIEGKREVGLLYNNFGQEKLDETAVRKVVESAVLYTINFDLLTPPFDSVKEISLSEMKSIAGSQTLKTGKRLGFKFQADRD